MADTVDHEIISGNKAPSVEDILAELHCIAFDALLAKFLKSFPGTGISAKPLDFAT